MINLREIRISILYFFTTALIILSILIVKRYYLINIKPTEIKWIIVGITFGVLILAIIPCVVIAVYHIIKAFRYNKIYYKERHYAEWSYSRDEWTRFIINNFKLNTTVELKSYEKAAVYYFAVMFIALLLDFSLNIKDRNNMPAYILIALACFFVFFAHTMLRSIISMIDHILFGNHIVILMEGTIIVNGEIFKLDVPLKQELIKKQIRNGNIEIEYAVPARYSDKYSNRYHLDVKDIKKLIIPVPDGKYKEAESYIKAPHPLKRSMNEK